MNYSFPTLRTFKLEDTPNREEVKLTGYDELV